MAKQNEMIQIELTELDREEALAQLKEVSNGWTTKAHDEDVEDDEFLQDLAYEYICKYTGNFSLLLSMQDSYRTYQDLTVPQLRGILNCIIAEKRRLAKALEPIRAVSDAGELVPLSTEPPNGTYTIVFTEDDYVTVQLRSAEWATGMPAGTRAIYLLVGPDNETDFAFYGFIRGGEIIRARGRASNERVELAWKILVGADTAALGDFSTAYAERSGRCSRCSRKLTVPASLHRGMGPRCAAGGQD